MRTSRLLGLSLLALLAVPGTARAQQAAPPIILNVLDFGAAGDGKADDTAALQKAFDAAVTTDPAKPGSRPTYAVYLPAGNYRVTQSLKLELKHKSLKIQGAGSRTPGGPAPTTITWDGAEGGFLFDCWAAFGIRLSDFVLDGGKKAGILLRINSRTGAVCAEWYVERVALKFAAQGVVCGDDSYVCSSDMTFVELQMDQLSTGFHTLSDQNLNYTFIRPEIGRCDIGIHFEKGGSVYAAMLSGWACGTVIKIGAGGINAGTYTFTNMRMESYKRNGKRQVLLETGSGEINVTFAGLQTTCLSLWPPDGDYDTPNFIIGPGTHLTVDTSLISGNVARLTGATGAPAWAQFNNCRFRVKADPRKIVCQDNAGYALRDCTIYPDDDKGEMTFLHDYLRALPPVNAAKTTNP